MRINKYLSQCNIGSRRTVEDFILKGYIKVNDEIVTLLSTQISEDDIVKFKNKIVKPCNNKIYILLNKPIGYITTVKDEKNRLTVMNLIKDVNDRVYPVGRLDCNTEGMLILTNDGEFANKLIHPSNEINKTYQAIINKKPNFKQLKQLRNGILIDDYITKPAIVDNIQRVNEYSYSLNITIHEGKNRQVRKMLDTVGLKVLQLKRIKIGNLTLGNLKTGKYKFLTNKELNLLNN